LEQLSNEELLGKEKTHISHFINSISLKEIDMKMLNLCL